MSLEVKNLRKSYDGKVVVNGLSFAMEGPGVYALLGTNGAGKTTSIRMMLDMLAKDEGEVLWNGEPLDFRKTNIGYLAEERGLYPKYTLMDQLFYFAKLKGIPREDAKKRIAYWAEKLCVEEYLYPKAKKKGQKAKAKNADQLSKGNQQKIQLMVALLSDPELLILDEPMSGLDPVNTDLFKNIIKEEIAKGKYLIMSSHQMPTIEEFCENIAIMNRGEVVLQGNLNEIKKSYGRVNLNVKCEGDISPIIDKMGIQVLEETPEEIRMKVTGEEQANEFLQEIFVEKVGAVHEE